MYALHVSVHEKSECGRCCPLFVLSRAVFWSCLDRAACCKASTGKALGLSNKAVLAGFAWSLAVLSNDE